MRAVGRPAKSKFAKLRSKKAAKNNKTTNAGPTMSISLSPLKKESRQRAKAAVYMIKRLRNIVRSAATGICICQAVRICLIPLACGKLTAGGVSLSTSMTIVKVFNMTSAKIMHGDVESCFSEAKRLFGNGEGSRIRKGKRGSEVTG